MKSDPELCQDSMQPKLLNSCIHSSMILFFEWREYKCYLLLTGTTAGQIQSWIQNQRWISYHFHLLSSLSLCEIQLCSRSIVDSIINSTLHTVKDPLSSLPLQLMWLLHVSTRITYSIVYVWSRMNEIQKDSNELSVESAIHQRCGDTFFKPNAW